MSNKPAAMFIGRWQPLHMGHYTIIKEVLDKGDPVVIAVRDTPVDDKNPYTYEQVQSFIHAAFGDAVEVIKIPDIFSINIGRNVGYDVNYIEVPTDIKCISATEIRHRLAEGDNSWKEMVAPGVAEVIEGIE